MPNYPAPIILGYTADIQTLPALEVHYGDKSTNVTIHYTPNRQQATIKYIDADTNKTINTQSLNGKTDETINVKLNLPNGYVLNNNEKVPSSYTFKAKNNQDLVIKLKHGTKNINLTKDITRTIKIHNGQKDTIIKQTATIQTSATQDLVTGEVIPNDNDWSTSSWNAYIVPTIEDYTPNIQKIPAQQVTKNTSNDNVNIWYTAKKTSTGTPTSFDKSEGHISTTGTPTTFDKPEGHISTTGTPTSFDKPEDHISTIGTPTSFDKTPLKVATNSNESIIKVPLTTTTGIVVSNKKQLPQTGNTQNHSWVAGLITGFSALILTLGFKKRTKIK